MNWRQRVRERFGERPPDPAALATAEERAKESRALVRRLREARAQAGLSLSDAERDTRINRVYLEAIEDGRFADLPAPVYARGFVRSYAKYLGLDAEGAVAAMPDLPPPLGLQPIAGLRRTVTPVLPAVNLPVAGAVVTAVLLALLAYFVLPGFGGSGLDLPEETPTATVTSTPSGGGQPGAGATVPPFEPGTAPSFQGVTRAEAQRVIETLEVTPLFVDATSDQPAGVVFGQSPAPGTEIQAGDVITLFVSTGP